MMLCSTILICALTIIISEIFSRRSVIYTRIVFFLLIFISITTIISILFFSKAEYRFSYLLVIITSCFPVLVSWFCFRIHMSNSISLNILAIISKLDFPSFEKITNAYNIPERIHKRKQELIKANYLNENGEIINNIKTRFIINLLHFLRGERISTN